MSDDTKCKKDEQVKLQLANIRKFTQGPTYVIQKPKNDVNWHKAPRLVLKHLPLQILEN